MRVVSTSSPRPALVVIKGTNLSFCRQNCFRPLRTDSSARRARTVRLQRVRTLTACKAQAAGSPTLERPGQVQQTAQQTDVVVIGSGIGGLCCAALLAKYGLKVLCDQHKALATQVCSHKAGGPTGLLPIFLGSLKAQTVPHPLCTHNDGSTAAKTALHTRRSYIDTHSNHLLSFQQYVTSHGDQLIASLSLTS